MFFFSQKETCVERKTIISIFNDVPLFFARPKLFHSKLRKHVFNHTNLFTCILVLALFMSIFFFFLLLFFYTFKISSYFYANIFFQKFIGLFPKSNYLKVQLEVDVLGAAKQFTLMGPIPNQVQAKSHVATTKCVFMFIQCFLIILTTFPR